MWTTANRSKYDNADLTAEKPGGIAAAGAEQAAVGAAAAEAAAAGAVAAKARGIPTSQIAKLEPLVTALV